MFQNLHLASYVNQLGLQQQQQLQQNRRDRTSMSGGRIISGLSSPHTPSQSAIRSPKTNNGQLIGGLPRQSYQEGNNVSSPTDYSSLNLMAVGSRLNMATYSKKESTNPIVEKFPGQNEAQKRAIRARSQLNNQQKITSVNRLAPQATKSNSRLSNINQDLLNIPNVKKRQARSVARRRPLQPLSVGGFGQNLVTEVTADDNEPQTAALEVAIDNEYGDKIDKCQCDDAPDFGLPRPNSNASLYKIQTPDEVKNKQTDTVDSNQRRVFELNKASGNNLLYPGLPNQQILPGLEIFKIKSPTKQGFVKTQLTVKASSTTVQKINQSLRQDRVSNLELDVEHSMNYEERGDQFATSSIVTQNQYQPGDDYHQGKDMGTQLLMTTNQSKQSAMGKSQQQRRDSSGKKGSLQNKTAVISSKITEKCNVLQTVAIDEGKDQKLLSMTPNLAVDTDLKKDHHERARTSMSGANGVQNEASSPSRLLHVSKGSSINDGGITTTMNKEGNSPLSKTILKVFNQASENNKNTVPTEQKLIQSPLSESLSANGLGDYKDQRTNLENIFGKIDEKAKNEQNKVSRSRTNPLKTPDSGVARKESSANNSPGFGTIEATQQQALFGITGNTLSQHLAVQNLQSKRQSSQWQQKKPSQIYGERLQVVGGTSGMKGAKLPRNSQFVRMQGYLKKKQQEQLSLNEAGKPQGSNSPMGRNNKNFISPLFAHFQGSQSGVYAMSSTNGLDEILSPDKNETDLITQAVQMQNRPKTQGHLRAKKTVGVQNESPELSQDNEANRALINMIQRAELRSWGSSQGDQQEHLTTAMMMEQLRDLDDATIILDGTPKNQDLTQSLTKAKYAEQFKSSSSPMDVHQMDRSGTMPELGFAAMVARESGVAVARPSQDNRKRENETQKLSSATPDNETGYVQQSYLEADSKELEGILDLQTEIIKRSFINQAESDTQNKHLAEQPKKSVGAILNMPLPIELDTIGSGRHERQETLKSSQRRKRNEIIVDTRIDKGGINPSHVSPQMRQLSKKDGQSTQQRRNSKSMASKKRSQRVQILAAQDPTQGINPAAKPQILFNESTMQQLFDSADQPIQQVIENIIMNDLDQFQAFGYAAQDKKMKQRTNRHLAVAAPFDDENYISRQSDHVKYEFIEKLLKQQNLDLHSKTLQEMADLYQNLLEKNQSVNSFSMSNAFNSQRDHESALVNSKQSLVILADRKNLNNTTVARLGSNSNHNDSVQTKQIESNGKLKALKDSRLSISPPMKQNSNKLALIGGKNLDLKNKSGKFSVAHISPQNIISSTKLVGRKHSSSNRFLGGDYGSQGRKKEHENSDNSLGIDGRKINILMKQEEVAEEPDINQDLDIPQRKDSSISPTFVKSNTLVLEQEQSQVNQDLLVTSSPQKRDLVLEESDSEGILETSHRQKVDLQAKVLLSRTQNEQSQPVNCGSSADASQFDENRKSGDNDNESLKQMQLFQQHRLSINDNNLTLAAADAFMNTMPRPVVEAISSKVLEIEQKLQERGKKQQFKTTKDVQSAQQILSFGVQPDEDIPDTNDMSNEEVIQYQMARSAYLSYQANMLNHRKVIVGNQSKDQKERQKFIDQLFQPTSPEPLSKHTDKDISLDYETPHNLKEQTIRSITKRQSSNSQNISSIGSNRNQNRQPEPQGTSERSAKTSITHPIVQPNLNENKIFIQHEQKVPKAGQLDAVRASRLRHLSSNQVTGFRIRGSSQKLDEFKDDALQKSSEDMKGQGVQKTKNKSQLDETEEVTSRQEKDHDNFMLGDLEDAGTQMMVSRANLTFNTGQTQFALHSPKFNGEPVDIIQKPFNQNRYSEQLYSSPKNKNSLMRHRRNSSQTVTTINSINQKIGTIKVKELYHGKNTEADYGSNENQVRQVRNTSYNRIVSQKTTNQSLLKHQRSHGAVPNFDRIAGMLAQSHADERKSRLVAHYQKIKDVKRETKAKSHWRHATPVISKGSTFYKDLFDLRKNKGSQDNFDSTMQPESIQKIIEQSQLVGEYTEEDAMFKQMLILSHTQKRPEISTRKILSLCLAAP